MSPINNLGCTTRLNEVNKNNTIIWDFGLAQQSQALFMVLNRCKPQCVDETIISLYENYQI